MKIIEKSLKDIKPYEKNPRKNDSAVDAVAASIKEFGWQQPIVVDKQGVIVAGHTRYKAAKKLGMKAAPCVVADELTEEQIKAYRLADNKTNELAVWDADLLELELLDLPTFDMADFGFAPDFDTTHDDAREWFESRERNDTSHQEDNDEYNEFLDKFKVKKTTDDCYTPDMVYDAVADWVAKEYKLDRKNFVRPFYPGGNYQAEKYEPEGVVVDNPPFSILSEIIQFYCECGIRFFLFAPTLTLFSSGSSLCCALPCGGSITYENGAVVATSFVTNLEDNRNRIRVIPELFKIIEDADAKNQARFKTTLPKYKFPKEVLTAAMCRYLCKHDTPLLIECKDSYHVRQLDAQKELDGSAIFGAGYLLSEKAAAEKAAAEKAAAEKAAAEKANAIEWALSDRERAIIASLGAKS